MQRLGRAMARHRRWLAVAWLLIVLGAGYLNGVFSKSVSDNFRIPNAGSQDAYDLLQERFQSQNGATATVVFSVPKGQSLDDQDNGVAVGTATIALAKVPGVATAPDPLGASSNLRTALQNFAGNLPPTEAQTVLSLQDNLPPQVSRNGRIAYTTVTFEQSLNDLVDAYPVNPDKAAADYENPYAALQNAIDELPESNVSIAIGGLVANTWNQPVSWWANHADEVGLLLGAILLLLAFGSVWGMAIPIAVALLGAITAGGLVYLFADFVTVSSAAPPVTLMIALGVGLDYSLLIVTRYRQHVHDGRSTEDAVGLALGSAGKASMFAGTTVCIALLGLLFVPIPLVQTLGVAAAIGVAVMMLAACTLLPALLGFAGHKIDALRLPWSKREEEGDPHQKFWGRFASRITAHPWFALIAGVIVLLVLATPFLRIHFGMPDASSLPSNLSQRQAFELTSQGFGPGVNGPLLVAVGLPTDHPQSFLEALPALEPINKALGALQPANTVPGVKYAVGPIPNKVEAVTAVVYQIIPETPPDASATSDLVKQLRSDLDTATAGTQLDAYVGGQTATLIDLTNVVTRYLPWVIGAVVLGAFLLLIVVFRSILVPLKAAVMNLLSIAAAYGVVVAVFQWGWAKGAVGLSATIPIVSFVPLVMFVILFGLSMDYEVFLMSRIREEWDRTQDPRESVVLGVANTARVITTAALIMIAVYASFVTNANPTVKLIGFGMAVAVLIDSTLLRMVLVPAVMELFGKAAWWFPRWLEWIPHVNIEGTPEPTPEPEPVAAGVTATDGDLATTPSPDPSPTGS